MVDSSTSRVLVGRQAIYDRDLNVVAYELLHRSSDANRAVFKDGDLATSQLLMNALIEIDEQVANFRYRHLQMVRRMIGTRIGTGGSSGEQYLQGAVNKNYIYKELAGIITFLIERRNLPQLPGRLHQALRFSAVER